MKDLLTTGQVAKICRMSQQTVIRWIDKGIINGLVIPGSKARRIVRDDLEAFMGKHGFPLSWLDDFRMGKKR